MNSPDRPKISRARCYWYAWFCIVALVFALRLTVFSNPAKGPGITLSGAYVLTSWLSIMALNFIEGRRLISYLKARHRTTWEHLTCVPGFGPGHANTLRTMRWIYSSDDLGDATLATMKAETKQFMRFALIVVLSSLVIFPLLSS